MEFDEAKDKFIQAWGTLGTSWGINKAMAQIHALLLIAPDALSTDEIMEELHISRGNVNMNMRALINWGIVYKEYKAGERKEFFKSEKDVWELARQVAAQRRKRELAPIIRVLDESKSVTGKNGRELEEFKKMTANLREFAGKATGILDRFTNSDKNWFFNFFMRLVK